MSNTDAQGGEGTDPKTGEGSKTGEGQTTPTVPTITKDTFDPEKYEAFVKNTRESELAAKQRAEAAEAKLKEIQDSQLSDAEKLQKERDDFKASAETLSNQIRDRDIRDSAVDVAQDLGFRNPKSAFRTIKDDVKFDSKGKPTNIEDLLNKLAEKEPYLLAGSARSDAGASGGGNTPNDMNALIRDRMRR